VVHAKASGSWSLGKVSSGFCASAILETINQYFDVVIIYWFLDPVSAGAYFYRFATRKYVRRFRRARCTTRHPSHTYAVFQRQVNELNQMLKLMAEVQLLCVAAGGAILGFGAETILGLFGTGFRRTEMDTDHSRDRTAGLRCRGPASICLDDCGATRGTLSVDRRCRQRRALRPEKWKR